MEVTYILTFLAIALAVFYYKFMKYKHVIDKVPGLPTLPLVGNAHQLKSNPTDFIHQIFDLVDRFREYGTFRLWLGMQPLILVFKPDFVEILLNSKTHIEKSYVYEYLHPWLGTGLLTSSGEKWFHRRKLLTPAFHFRILNDFVSVFNEQAQIMVNKLESRVGKAEFNIFPYITLCALDIICETAMGRTVNAQGNADSEYVKDIYKISDLIQNRQKKPWFHTDFMYNTFGEGKEFNKCLKVLHGFTKAVIKEKKEEFQKVYENYTMEKLASDDGRKKRLAFLDLLLCRSEDGMHLSPEDIQEEVDTFMFEGHDTTAAGSNWTIYLLGMNPEVQEKVHQELDAVFGDSEEGATMEQLKELKYLECVLKESLRLFPSVPIIGRTLTEDQDFGEYHLPKGTNVAVLIAGLHKDPKHFPDPMNFDPNRFLPENIVGRHPFSYVPFSAGPRNCIGQKFALLEEKVIVSSILRKFKVKCRQTLEDLDLMGELILRPGKGIIVKLTERN